MLELSLEDYVETSVKCMQNRSCLVIKFESRRAEQNGQKKREQIWSDPISVLNYNRLHKKKSHIHACCMCS